MYNATADINGSHWRNFTELQTLDVCLNACYSDTQVSDFKEGKHLVMTKCYLDGLEQIALQLM